MTIFQIRPFVEIYVDKKPFITRKPGYFGYFRAMQIFSCALTVKTMNF